MLPHFVSLAWDRRQSLIVRPHSGAGNVLAQLDDIRGGALERMRSKAFLTLETSPGSYQAWLAIVGADDRLVRRLVKNVGVDWNASCAVRVAGSPNCKVKYAPDFPTVRISRLQLFRKILPVDVEEDLEPDSIMQPQERAVQKSSENKQIWPEWDFFLRKARSKDDGSADLSRIDYTWAMVALKRGFAFDAVVERLQQISPKAKAECNRKNKGYARRTVLHASQAH